MYKTLFQNSKAALLFAGMTILGAVMMVGSPEDEGVLDKAVDRFGKERETFVEGAQEFAETQSVPDKVMDPDAGWGRSPQPDIGNYAPEDSEPDDFYAPVPVPGRAPPKATTFREIPGPQPVMGDNVGTPVPGPDDQPGTPVITSRQMTLTPQ